MELNTEELQTISNLLFNGKFGFSLQENQRVVTPLINKLAKMLDEGLPKKEKKNAG